MLENVVALKGLNVPPLRFDQAYSHIIPMRALPTDRGSFAAKDELCGEGTCREGVKEF